MSEKDKDKATASNEERVEAQDAELEERDGASGAQADSVADHVESVTQVDDEDDDTLSFIAEESASQQLVELEKELADVKKRLAEADIRAAAQVQNIRKRAERDVEHAHKYALEKFASDLLAVADNLERGLEALPKEDDDLTVVREGMELTLKSLLDTFSRYNLVQINPAGEPFNPEHHEAMTMVPSAELEPNSVMDVLEKGYLLNGRLIRPARVIVSKGV